MLFLQGFIKFDQGISEKCVGQTFEGRKKEEEEEEEEEAKPPFFVSMATAAKFVQPIRFAWLISFH